MFSKICIASCFLPLESPIWQVWDRLAQELAKHEILLVLLSTTYDKYSPNIPIVPWPYLLSEFAKWFPKAIPSIVLGRSSFDDYLLASDAAWSNHAYHPQVAFHGLQACRNVWEKVLNILEPEIVLLWNATHSQTTLMQLYCWQMGIPIYAIERGFLPDTVMIDSWSINGYSDARSHWLSHGLSTVTNVDEIFQAALKYYLSNKPQKYSQPTFEESRKRIKQELGLQTKKVILFLGQGDAAGLDPRDWRSSRKNAPIFASTRECVIALHRTIADDPQIQLLFKPHPLDPTDYSDLSRLGVVVLSNQYNVHALIDAVDVVACQFTTLQYETVFYDKPVLLMGRSAWWGRNATYEINSPEELPHKLEAALTRKDWRQIKNNAIKFLAWALENYLIGYNESVPTRWHLKDLADFIARSSLYATSCRVSERIKKLYNLLFELSATHVRHLYSYDSRLEHRILYRPALEI